MGPMVTLTASARSLTPRSMAARASMPKVISFAAYPRAHCRCSAPPLPTPRASCLRSAEEEDLEMAAAAARYMAASRLCGVGVGWWVSRELGLLWRLKIRERVFVEGRWG